MKKMSHLKRFIGIFILFALAPANLSAAVGDLIWDYVWNHVDAVGVALAVERDDVGNIYVCGISDTGNPTFYEKGSLKKFDPLGTLLWERQIDGTLNVFNEAVLTDLTIGPSGEVYVVGTDDPYSGSGSAWLLLLAYDSNGTLLWEKREDPGNYFYAGAIDYDDAGFLYLSGDYSDGSVWGYRIEKRSALDGSLLASKLLSGDSFIQWGFHDGCSVVSDDSGGIYWTSFDFIMKTDRDLNSVWSKIPWDIGADDAGEHISLSADGSLLYNAGGNPGSGSPCLGGGGPSQNRNHVSAINTSDGTVAWQTVLSGVGPDLGTIYLRDAVEAPDGGVYVTGSAFEVGATSDNHNLFVAKVNPPGTVEWYRHFTDVGTEPGICAVSRGYDITLAQSGNVIVAGTRGNYQENYVTGNKQDWWVMELEGVPFPPTPTPTPAPTLTPTPGPGSPAWVISSSGTMPIDPTKGEYVTICVDANPPSTVLLDVYDLMSTKVRTVFNGTVSGNPSCSDWDGLNDSSSLVAPGTYLVPVIVDGIKVDDLTILIAY